MADSFKTTWPRVAHYGRMGVHLGSATMFMTANARLVDQRRLAYHLGECAPEGVLRALDAYRNDDGGLRLRARTGPAGGEQPTGSRAARFRGLRRARPRP